MSLPRCAALLPQTILFAARLSVAGLIVVAGGCAAGNGGRETPAHVAGPPVGQVPGATRVLIEDDGLPAQLAPRHPRPVVDDPSEPWSPNYGSRAPQKSAEPLPEPATRPGIRVEPVSRQARLALTRISEADQDALIRRAIAEHEMRRGD